MRTTGFYSVVQFCPDLVRGEVINIGVIVGSPGLGMRARMAERNEYVKSVFGVSAYDDTWLSFAKTGLIERLKEVEPTMEAVAKFISQESGQVIPTPPRPMIVKDLVEDSLSLFLRLVSDPEAPPAGASGSEDMWRQVVGERSMAVGKLGRVRAPKGVRLRKGAAAGEADLGILLFDELVSTEHG